MAKQCLFGMTVIMINTSLRPISSKLFMRRSRQLPEEMLGSTILESYCHVTIS